MPPPPIPNEIPCDSAAAFAREVKDAAQIIEQDETEQNWDKIGRELQRVAALFRGGAYEFEVEVVAAIRPLTIPIVNAMKSERSRLSFEAIELVSTLAGLGRAYEPLLRNFFSTLLELCTRTSKILVARAQAAVMRTIEETRLAAVVPHLRDATKDKSQSLRTVASTAILRVLNILSRAELNSKAADIEEIIKNTGRDSNPAVRQISRQVFEAYQLLFPERVDAFIAPLTPITRKYLAVKPNANPVKINFSAPVAANPATARQGNRSRTVSQQSVTAAVSAPTPVSERTVVRKASRTMVRVERQPTEQSAAVARPVRLPPVSGAAQRQRTLSANAGPAHSQAVLDAIRKANAALAITSSITAAALIDAPTPAIVKRSGPQRVLAESQPAPSEPRPRTISASRAQRPITIIGSASLIQSGAEPLAIALPQLELKPQWAPIPVPGSQARPLHISSDGSQAHATDSEALQAFPIQPMSHAHPDVQLPMHTEPMTPQQFQPQSSFYPEPADLPPSVQIVQFSVARPEVPMYAVPRAEAFDSAQPKATHVFHRAQRILVQQSAPPPDPVPMAASKETVKVQEKPRERVISTIARPPSSASNPISRPESVAAVATRAKPPVSSRSNRAGGPPVPTTSAIPKYTMAAPPPLQKSVSAPSHAKGTSLSRLPLSATASGGSATDARTGFVPRRNRDGGGGGATQMTVNAIARAKEAQDAREARERAAAQKAAASTRGAWGSGAAKKTVGLAKNVGMAHILRERRMRAPVEVPLPPSPGAPPREFPLPPSPQSSRASSRAGMVSPVYDRDSASPVEHGDVGVDALGLGIAVQQTYSAKENSRRGSPVSAQDSFLGKMGVEDAARAVLSEMMNQ